MTQVGLGPIFLTSKKGIVLGVPQNEFHDEDDCW
jgi:hypothetical protein